MVSRRESTSSSSKSLLALSRRSSLAKLDVVDDSITCVPTPLSKNFGVTFSGVPSGPFGVRVGVESDLALAWCVARGEMLIGLLGNVLDSTGDDPTEKKKRHYILNKCTTMSCHNDNTSLYNAIMIIIIV